MLRLRANDLQSDNGNNSQLKDTLSAVTPLTHPSVSINNKWLREFGISYFFTPTIATELVLTYPQKQTVYANYDGGKAAIGSFKHLPPTLMAQYHFTGLPVLRP